MISRFFTVLSRTTAWIRSSLARGGANAPIHTPAAVIDRFDVALAAHDCLTLLTIMGRCAGAMRHAGAEDDYLEFQRAADRMNLTARQLMSVQQADIGQPELLDLNQIVAESHGMLARAIAQGLFLRLELGAVRGLRMAATRWDLERILLHLVRNASRTIATGGVVLIETLYMQQVPGGLRPPHIRARPYVRLIVSNSGMPSAAAAGAVPHLSPSHQDGGDLGLSTVWRLVTQMNGVLQFDGDAESRTRIRVDFPLASDD